MERRVGREHAVGELERVAEALGLDERAVARRVHVREVDDRAHPAGAAADLDAVRERAEVPHAAHHLDPERHRSVLPLEPLADDRELLDDRVDRILATASEQEARMEHDDLGAAGGRDAGAPIECAERRRPLSPAGLEMADPAEQRRMDGERDVVLACELPEALRPRIVHPEPGLEVDLAGVVAAFAHELDRVLGALARGHAGGADADPCHPSTLRYAVRPGRCLPPGRRGREVFFTAPLPWRVALRLAAVLLRWLEPARSTLST